MEGTDPGDVGVAFVVEEGVFVVGLVDANWLVDVGRWESETYPNALMYPKVLNMTHQQASTAIHAWKPPSGKVGGLGASGTAALFSVSVDMMFVVYLTAGE